MSKNQKFFKLAELRLKAVKIEREHLKVWKSLTRAEQVEWQSQQEPLITKEHDESQIGKIQNRLSALLTPPSRASKKGKRA